MSFVIQPISKRFIKSNVFQELFTFRRGTTLFHLSCCKFKRACLLLRESLCGLHVFSTVGKRAFRYSRNVVNLNNSNEEEGMKLDNISLARPSPVVKVLFARQMVRSSEVGVWSPRDGATPAPTPQTVPQTLVCCTRLPKTIFREIQPGGYLG